MQACRQIESGERAYPNLILTGFRSPALPKLLALGAFYVATAISAIFLSSLLDDGAFLKVLTNVESVDQKALPDASFQSGMMLFALFFLPAVMAFWFAAPLIVWNGMNVIKAIFYSIFAVKHAARAFVVYGLGLLMVNFLSSIVLSLIVVIVGGNMLTLMIVVLPFSIAISVVTYCSFYPSYADIFVPPRIGTHIEEIA